jgi:hypothetical protein
MDDFAQKLENTLRYSFWHLFRAITVKHSRTQIEEGFDQLFARIKFSEQEAIVEAAT